MERGGTSIIVIAPFSISRNKRKFNWDVLNVDNSIMVNPESVEDKAKAIAELRDNIGKRKSMSIAAVKTTIDLTIDSRTIRIIDFMK